MTTNYIDYKMSAHVSSEFRRVITGKTDIVTMASGRERRNAAWAFKKMQFSANFVMLSPDAQHAVVSAFYACNAQLYLFRFRDAGDYQVVASPLTTTTLVGTVNPVQLTKRYTFGSAYADRTVQAIGTCIVLDNTSTPVAGTFNNALGLFTPSSAWGSGVYTWSGTFDVWVRFNSDELDVTLKTIDIATTDVELAEQRAYDSTVMGGS